MGGGGRQLGRRWRWGVDSRFTGGMVSCWDEGKKGNPMGVDCIPTLKALDRETQFLFDACCAYYGRNTYSLPGYLSKRASPVSLRFMSGFWNVLELFSLFFLYFPRFMFSEFLLRDFSCFFWPVFGFLGWFILNNFKIYIFLNLNIFNFEHF
jgi:hypothetical protein